MRSLLAVGVIVALLAACGADSDDEEPRNPLALYPWQPGDATMDALIGGVLQRDGECLYIATAGGDRVFVAFPETRAAWNEGEQALFFDGRRIGDGGPTTLGGGFSQERDYDDWPAPPGDDCDDSSLWIAGGLGPTVN
jgi:hypothetical protein